MVTHGTGRSVKRIHFTAEDLARTRVAPTIGVAAETFDSVRMLRDRDAGPAFRGWQASVRGRLGEQAGPLAALMAARGPLIDAMSLMGAAPSIDEAVDTWMEVPRPLLRAELEHIGFHPAHRTWARGLLYGTREARLQVAAALRSCHRVTVAPYWGRVRSHLGEVRAGYVRALAEGGSTGSSPRSADRRPAGVPRAGSGPRTGRGRPSERARSGHRPDDAHRHHAGPGPAERGPRRLTGRPVGAGPRTPPAGCRWTSPGRRPRTAAPGDDPSPPCGGGGSSAGRSRRGGPRGSLGP